MIKWRGWLVALALLSVPACAAAQETPAGDGEPAKLKPSPLGVRQQRVERMMEDLERKFKSLAQTLEKTEPERAERLIKTLQQSKQLLIQQRMGGISRMLDQAKLDSATGEQKKMLADLRELINLLLDEHDRTKTMEEYERLQKWKEEIAKILDEQRPQRNESDKIANMDKTQADLAARIKAVEELIKKEEAVIKTTEAARAKGIDGLGKAANEQKKVREETEKLAQDIAKSAQGPQSASASEGKSGEPKAGEGKAAGGKAGEGKAGEGKGGEGKGGEGKGGEGKGGEGKGGEGKGGEGKGGEGKGGEGKGGEGKGGEGKEGEGKPGESGNKSSQPPEPGQRPLERAAGHQQSAEQKLDEGKGKAGQQDEELALNELHKALEELKKESRRLASLPKEAFDEMASKQNQTADKTGGLQEQMEKAEAGGGGEGGGEGGGKGKKSPGKEQVKQAQKNMQQASGNLKKQDPAGATRQQDEAIKQLEKALKEIEDRLAQLREETQVEKLARLEARFVEMLARQKAVSAGTIELDKAKAANGELKRTERLALAKHAEEERALAESAQQALDIIVEDGTSVVFPEIVEGLRDDLSRVGEMLEGQKTEGYTQAVQKEIESTLEELIEALQKIQQQKKEGGGGGGGGGDEPLFPNSAELKLLRSAQLRVNRRTEAFDKNRPSGELDETLKKEVVSISVRQEQIQVMTERILDRQ